MNRRLIFSSLCCFLPLASLAQPIIALRINGTINPVVADYIHRGIEKARSERAECLLIELNTPGGLLKSTRVIVGDLLASPVPVVVFVSPAGAQAGSAGVFITLSADIAAMAPGTNLGAAHPVGGQEQPDSIMNEKITNDAAAFIRSIAAKRHRDIQWAETAVRNSVSVSENEALTTKVIDLIARNRDDLLQKIDGRRIELESGDRTLHTRGAPLIFLEMGFVEKILNIISDPTVAYILMMLGIYGLLFELYNPGSIFPGIVGVISLVLAFYSFHMLPVNYAGLSLIVFGIILFLLEIKIVSHGLLGIGGAVSLLMGSLMLIHTSSTLEFVRISRAVIFASVALSAFFFLGVIAMGLKAQRLKPVTGAEGIIGATGITLETLAPAGTVQVRGEIWRATTMEGDITKGEKVEVVGLDNLTLRVRSITM
ncbi:MAG: serine protease [Sphingobacteriales bacterium 50-39]|nr:nodulation protein NfeD [Sphingobacteriales bacterium]OJW55644.1 MAG: serine protease [Sphingobacteriales bacterium 50-39]